MNILDNFSLWMQKNTLLKDTSIYKYQRAINTISNDMFELNIISKSLFDMNLVELDVAIANILNNQSFIKKNTTGNKMYSNALKQYRYYVISCFDLEVSELEIVDEIMSSGIDYTEKETIIKARIGQGVYRKNILEKYNNQCLVTGIDNIKLLVASHIKPWAICNNNERIDVNNGLLLSANMDRLFDCGLITFNNIGKMFISSFVGKENEKRLQISQEIIVDLKPTDKLLDYLEYHQDVLLFKFIA
ncbi:HNH endonuclease [Phascolarctobacterium faecium]|jgi:putative type II restriction enzyme hphI|uniref:HNH endonuclease n=1 Tax=Phascolarctobacterium faecium TaxID=33025 RepID=UPI003992F8AF